MEIAGEMGILQQESRLDAHGAAGRQQPNFGVAEDRDGRSHSGNGTFQAQSAPGDIDHLKITGGKGIYQRESVILYAGALLAINPSKCNATTNFLERDFAGVRLATLDEREQWGLQ